jgi:hypothetical protein
MDTFIVSTHFDYIIELHLIGTVASSTDTKTPTSSRSPSGRIGHNMILDPVQVRKCEALSYKVEC